MTDNQDMNIGIHVDSQQAVEATDKYAESTIGAKDATEKLGTAIGPLGDGFKSLAKMQADATGTTEDYTKITTDAADATKARADAENVLTDAQRLQIEQDRAAALAARETAMADEQAAAATKARADSIAGSIAIQQGRNLVGATAAMENYSASYRKLSNLAAMGTPTLFRAGAGLGIAGLFTGYEAIKKYMDFHRAMLQSVTQAGVPLQWLPDLQKQLLQMSTQTGQSVNDLANSLYRVASGTAAWNNGLGATKKQLIDVTRQVSNLTVLGDVPAGASSEQSARLVAAVANANLRGLGKNPNSVAAMLNAAVGTGDIRFTELISALGKGVMTSGKLNNIPADALFSYIDLMTTMGTTGSVAGTYAKTALNLILNPSTQGSHVMAMLGIKPGTLQNLVESGPNGFDAAIRLLGKRFTAKLNVLPGFPSYKKNPAGAASAIALFENWGANSWDPGLIADWKSGALDNPNPNDKKLIAERNTVRALLMTKAYGGARQMASVATLLTNVPQFEAIRAHIDKNANLAVYNRDVRLAENQPAVTWARIKNQVTVALINLGEKLTPIALKLGKAFADLLTVVSSSKPVLYGILALMTGVLAKAGIAKFAAGAKEMYPHIGKWYTQSDSLLTHLGGRAATANRPANFLGKFIGRGGSSFRQAYGLASAGEESKLGLAFLTSANTQLEAATLQVRAAEMATGKSMGGGGGGLGNQMGGQAAKREMSAGEKAFMEHARIAGNLTPQEFEALKFHSYKGSPALTKASLRAFLADKGYASDTATVDSMFGKLAPLMDRAGNLTPAAEQGLAPLLKMTSSGGMVGNLAGDARAAAMGGSAVSDVVGVAGAAGGAAADVGGAVAGAGGTLALGMGGIGADAAMGALSMFGGPVGLGLMAASIAIPMILPHLAGLFFGKGPTLNTKYYGGTNTTNPALRAQIAALKAKLKLQFKDAAAGAGMKGGASLLDRWLNTNKALDTTGALYASQLKPAGQQRWVTDRFKEMNAERQAATILQNMSKPGFHNSFGPGSSISQGLFNALPKHVQNQLLMAGIPIGQPLLGVGGMVPSGTHTGIGSLLNDIHQNTAALSTSWGQKMLAKWGKGNSGFIANMIADSTARSQSHQLWVQGNAGGFAPKTAGQNLNQLIALDSAIKMAEAMKKQDQKSASSSTGAAKNAYAEEAKKLQSKIDEMSRTAHRDAETLHRDGLTDQKFNQLADAIAKAQAPQLGMTGQQLADAFATAVASQIPAIIAGTVKKPR